MAGFSSIFSASSSLLVLFFLIGFASANDVLVGGKIDAWKIPSSESESLDKWASKARFQVGDNLVWKYDAGKDSVLEVTKEDYASCNITNPIKKYNDGNTKVELNHPGPFYFISGAKGHCEKGEKVIVVVISPRGHKHTAISPAPSPAEQSEDGSAGPAVAPSPTSSAVALKGGFVMVMFGVFAIWGF